MNNGISIIVYPSGEIAVGFNYTKEEHLERVRLFEQSIACTSPANHKFAEYPAVIVTGRARE